jgi:hypothetical protein
MRHRLFVPFLLILVLSISAVAIAQQQVNITRVAGQTVTQVIVTPVPVTALSNTVTTIQSSGPKKLDLYECYNPNGSAAYVQVFDISGTVTLGTSTAKNVFGIAANSRGGLAAMGLTYSNAIKVAATTTATGSTAPGTALVCNFGWW